MKIGRMLLGLAVAMVAVLTQSPARALSITTTPLFVGTTDFSTGQRVLAGPDNAAGGGTLDSLMRAAADYWEGIVGDSFNLNVTFGWEKGLGSNVLGATVITGSATVHRANIAFAADAATPWFIDPTPPDPSSAAGNSEYGTFSAPERNLGAGTVNTGLVYTDPAPSGDAATRFDLFSVALHELEHALGLARLCSCQLIDIGSPISEGLVIRDPLPDAGSVIPICCGFDDFSHLAISGSLMSPSIGFGERGLPSDADILAIAQVNRWTDVTLHAAADIPEPATMTTLIFGAIAIRRMRRRASIA